MFFAVGTWHRVIQIASSLAHVCLLSIAGRRTVERCMKGDMGAFIESRRAVLRSD
jgi:hypothetical protein